MNLRALLLLGAAALATLAPTAVAQKKPPPYACNTDDDCEEKFPGTVCIEVNLYGDIVRKCTPNTDERPACRGAQPGLCPSYQAEEVGYLNVHCVFVAKDGEAEAPVSEAGSSSKASSASASASESAPASGSGSGSSTKRRFLQATNTTAPTTKKPAATPAAEGSAEASEKDTEASEKGSTDGEEVEVPKSEDGSSGEVTAPAPSPVKNSAKLATVMFGKTKVTGEFKCVDVSACATLAYDKSTCEPEECGSKGSKMQCNNQGTCSYPSTQTMKKRRCMCYKGFAGDKCQQEISNECDVDCGLGGDCVDGECKCKRGFDGREHKGKKGKPNQRCKKCTNDLACQNGNACDIETGTCVCGPGFFGPTCGATEDSCTKRDCGIGQCQVLGNGSSACFCPFCSPDCQLCKTKDCSTCPSPATTVQVSKTVLFVSTFVAVVAANFVF